jgi:hypothetical protein
MEDASLKDIGGDVSLSQVLKQSREFANQPIKEDPLATTDII